jgi:hypothetical protein
MGPQRMPGLLEKRAFLYAGKATPEGLSDLGSQYLEDGHLDSALEFCSAAGDAAGVERVKRAAIQDGETGVLIRVERGGRVSVTAEDWRAAAESAARLGKHAQAAAAWTRGGDPGRAAAEWAASPCQGGASAQSGGT